MLDEGDYILPVGKRSVDYYRNRKMFRLVTDEFMSVEHFEGKDSHKAAEMVKELYDGGEIGAVCLISTKFNSMLSQTPELIRLLPLKDLAVGREANEKAAIEYEPSAEEVLAALIPEYIAGILATSVAESYASELAARRSAMDTATKNADEMLGELNLTYNRARQGAITQEITEIVAGANA
jgi:F-type H+-transporting ATPase subunit gamma